jgi:hypothetical protein
MIHASGVDQRGYAENALPKDIASYAQPGIFTRTPWHSPINWA